MKYLYYSVLTLFICGFLGLQLQAQTTVRLVPSQDNTLYENAEAEVSNGQGIHIKSSRTNEGLLRRGLMQFDLSSIPSDATIQSVALTMNVTKTRGGEEAVRLFRVSQAWGEGASEAEGEGGQGAPAQAGDATWNFAIYPDVRWERAGGDFEARASATTMVNELGMYTWSDDDLVADVQNWLANPESNFGWGILSQASRARLSKRYASRESNTPPNLVITYTTAGEEEEVIDLELSLDVENPELPKFTAQNATLTLTNTGNSTATGVAVSFGLPQGEVVLVGGTTPETSRGTYNAFDGMWTVGTLEAGATATLQIQLFPLSDAYEPYAQVTAADQRDADSEPGNGDCCYESEDDEASLLGMEEEFCDLLSVIDLPDDICQMCLDEIAIYRWNDELYYVELDGPNNPCTDALTRVLDCEGNEICRDGGFAGFRECERSGFFDEAVKVETIARCELSENIDLSLSLSSDNSDIRQWESGNFTLSVTNNSRVDATGVTVDFALNPDEVVQVGGSEIRASMGDYNNFDGVWKGIDVAAGESVKLTIALFSKVSSLQLYAQIATADQADSDSTPGNGSCCSSNEDDEVVFTSSNEGRNYLVDGTSPTLNKIFPNPIKDVLHIELTQERTAYQILDLTGRVLQAGQLSYSNQLPLSDLAAGVYILKMEQAAPIRLVKQ